jgi:dephospho-CoA kinase
MGRQESLEAWNANSTRPAAPRHWPHRGASGVKAASGDGEGEFRLRSLVGKRIGIAATLSRLLSDGPAPLRPGLVRVLGTQPPSSNGQACPPEPLGPPTRLEELSRPRWSGRQRRIGLTGGIATGKSAVGRLLEERHGLPVLDADRFAREALAPESPGARAVLERYGDQVRPGTEGLAAGEETGGSSLSGHNSDAGVIIDRAALGRIVFAHPHERRWLEELVHPLVRHRCLAELQRLAAVPTLVLMVPLLFEAGLESLCSEVWLVDCNENQQLERLIGRDRLSEAEARARIEAQWPLARKRTLVDRCIDNSGDLQALEQAVLRALQGPREA